MRSFIRALPLGVGLLGLGIFAYGLNLYLKLKPIMANPQLKLIPNIYVPVVVGETRKINLGYLTVSVPATLKGDLARFDDVGTVVLGAARPFPVIFFSPDPEDQSRAKMVAEEFKQEPISSEFELEKRELAQQPFTIWDIPRMGRSGAIYRETLLLGKSLGFPNATSVGVLEKNGLGIFVVIDGAHGTNHGVRLEIHDLKMGTFQRILIDPGVHESQEIVSAIADSYKLHPNSGSRDSILSQIELAGLPLLPRAEPTASQPAQR